uniref:MSP1 protein-like protein n=1 Tax=Ganoderma boninense TaxID=34458 RepID=A0A5K1JXW6_9APHY|nr:MSP1 protein-like protein [Ganoderma boninense]
MAALLASRRSSEGSLPPLDWPYSRDSWQPEDDLEFGASGASPLLHGAIFCGEVAFPMNGDVLLSISPRLHDLVFATNTSCGEWSHDLDDDLLDLSWFLEAGSRNFLQRTAPCSKPPLIRDESCFEEISAIIHLSRKYESAHLYHSAVAWLERHFTPGDLRFDMRRLQVSSRLALSAWLSVDDLTNGYVRDDRGKETLSLDNIVRVRLTRDRLVGACIVSATCVYRSQCDPACGGVQCGDSLDKMRQTSVDSLLDTRPSQPMRFPLLQGSAVEHAKAGLCAACAEMVKAREGEAQEEIWSLLPCIAGEVVPSWAGQCPKHCPAPDASRLLSNSGCEESEDCYVAGPVHDWMHYRRTCQ